MYMESKQIDLDINNYTKSDLISFFKLNTNYSNSELEYNEQLIKKSILNSNYDSKYKYELLVFILLAKDILKIKEDENKKIAEQPENKTINNIGKILNPTSSHPVLQRQSIISDRINAYGNYVRKTNYVFDTRYRDDFFNTIAVDATFTLPIKLNNVIAITLSSIQFANTFFTFNSFYQTNQLYIFEETTNRQAVVILPEGNYTALNFPLQLEKAINQQVVGVYNPPPGVNRFTVSISEFTGFTTITNSTYNFRMNLLRRAAVFSGEICNPFIATVKLTSMDPEEKIRPENLFRSMGYQIGYRQIEYTGKKSYTSESQFDSLLTEVIYFAVKDFNSDSVFTTTYGVAPQSLIDKNILAVIPVTTPAFTITWDTMANYIYKVRKYQAPIDIEKIKVSLLSRSGNLLDFHENNYAFVLEVDTIYDNVAFYNTLIDDNNNINIINKK